LPTEVRQDNVTSFILLYGKEEPQILAVIQRQRYNLTLEKTVWSGKRWNGTCLYLLCDTKRKGIGNKNYFATKRMQINYCEVFMFMSSCCSLCWGVAVVQCVPERSVRLSVYLFSSKLSFMLKLWWIIS